MKYCSILSESALFAKTKSIFRERNTIFFFEIITCGLPGGLYYYYNDTICFQGLFCKFGNLCKNLHAVVVAAYALLLSC